MRDPEFDMIRVRGYGSYAFRVSRSDIFLKELFGTNSTFNTEDITSWLKTMLVSALTDVLGESKVSALDLAGNTLEFNQIVRAKIQEKFAEIGLELTNLFVENMSVPEEVEKALDERSKLGILGAKTDVMMKIAAAEALKDAANNQGVGGAFVGAGMGVGAGVGLGSVFAEAMKPIKEEKKETSGGATCSKCQARLSLGAKFCSECGAKIESARFCSECGEKVSASAKFCPSCGKKLV